MLPLLMKVKYAQGKEPRAVILAPTNELVVQLAEHARNFAKYTDLRFVAIYGGVGVKAHVDSIALGVDILVATPGRFMEIYLKGSRASDRIYCSRLLFPTKWSAYRRSF